MEKEQKEVNEKSQKAKVYAENIRQQILEKEQEKLQERKSFYGEKTKLDAEEEQRWDCC